MAGSDKPIGSTGQVRNPWMGIAKPPALSPAAAPIKQAPGAVGPPPGPRNPWAGIRKAPASQGKK